MGFTVRFLLGTVLVLSCFWSIQTHRLVRQTNNGESKPEKVQKIEEERIANLSESNKPKTDLSTEANTTSLSKPETYKKATDGIPRSIDIDKYVSKEFHNKNNVYTLPVSADSEKYIDPDYPYHPTSQDHDHTQEFHYELTTPRSTLFDHKFKEAVESVDQTLEHIDDDHEIALDADSSENLNLEKLHDETKNNDTKANLSYVNYRKIIANDTAGSNSIQKDVVVEAGTNLDFHSSYNETKVLDEEDDGNNTIVKEPSQEIPDQEKSESSTTKSIHLTTKKSLVTKPPNKNSSHISILSNNIETETLKAIRVEQLTTTPKPKVTTSTESTRVANEITEKSEQLFQENQVVPHVVEAPSTTTIPRTTTTTEKMVAATVKATEATTVPVTEATTVKASEATTQATEATTLLVTETTTIKASEATTQATEATTVATDATTATTEQNFSSTIQTTEATTPISTTEESTTVTVPATTTMGTSPTAVPPTAPPTTTVIETTTQPITATETTTEMVVPTDTTTITFEQDLQTTTQTDFELTTTEESLTTTISFDLTTTEALLSNETTTESTMRSSKAIVFRETVPTTETISTTTEIGTTIADVMKPRKAAITTAVPNLGTENRTSTEEETDTTSESEITTENNTVSSDELNTIPPEDNSGTIAAIVISSIGALCLILLAGLLVIMRKRQKRFNYAQRCRPVNLQEYSVENTSTFSSIRRKGGLRSSKKPYQNPAFEDPAVSHPLNFPALGKFASNMEDIQAEFGEIPMITARTNELPEGCDVKNRYANVIPLPETRVYLNYIDGYPNSDYINANYVTGPKDTKRYYIACQAPIQSTVDDFWRMVWEQQTKVILMLTHLFENGVEKCADYLPPSEVLDCHRAFGDFLITLKKREVKDKYIISILQLKNMVSSSWREVTHFWYLGWPEKGVPLEANSLIAFLIEARSYMKAASIDRRDVTSLTNGTVKNELNPVVVHCSPGTGRTGVVIACDIAIREFEQSRLVDVPRIVYKIRRDRASAVQTKEQYAFIYKVVSLYATKLTGGALDSL